MYKYYVKNLAETKIAYEGFDYYVAAAKVQHMNSNSKERWHVACEDLETEFDAEVFESGANIHIIFADDEKLTSLYGDDDAIRRVINERLIVLYGDRGKHTSYELEYSNPGDSGDNATFHIDNLIFNAAVKQVVERYAVVSKDRKRGICGKGSSQVYPADLEDHELRLYNSKKDAQNKVVTFQDEDFIVVRVNVTIEEA